MSLDCNIEPGQGIEWFSKFSGRPVRHTYLVVDKEGSGFKAVPVLELHDYTKCYDDVGASYETDRDNVRLDYSPEVFTGRRKASGNGRCYVYADMGQAKHISRAFLKLNHVEVIDGGRTIDDRDMQVVKNHPWPHDLQQEKTSDSGGARPDRRKKGDDLAASDDEELMPVDPLKPDGGGLSPADRAALGRKAQAQRRQRESGTEDFTAQGSGGLRKALAKPGLPDLDGKTGPGKTGPKRPGE